MLASGVRSGRRKRERGRERDLQLAIAGHRLPTVLHVQAEVADLEERSLASRSSSGRRLDVRRSFGPRAAGRRHQVEP